MLIFNIPGAQDARRVLHVRNSVGCQSQSSWLNWIFNYIPMSLCCRAQTPYRLKPDFFVSVSTTSFVIYTISSRVEIKKKNFLCDVKSCQVHLFHVFKSSFEQKLNLYRGNKVTKMYKADALLWSTLPSQLLKKSPATRGRENIKFIQISWGKCGLWTVYAETKLHRKPLQKQINYYYSIHHKIFLNFCLNQL